MSRPSINPRCPHCRTRHDALKISRCARQGDHPITEYGTTRCPVEQVAAEIDDAGECSACGAAVLAPSTQEPPR